MLLIVFSFTRFVDQHCKDEGLLSGVKRKRGR